MPAVLNVCWYVDPLAMSSLVADPSSRVTVWAVVSLFVHVTVVPTATVIVAGENAKSAMVTAPALVAAPAEAAGGAPVRRLDELEQAPIASATTAMKPMT